MLGIHFYTNTKPEGYFINTSIEEASGIDYHVSRDTLFVVDDEGIIFEITKTGQILREKYLGDYDLEGITVNYLNDNELILAVEGDDSLLYLDVNTLEIVKNTSINRLFGKKQILKADEEYGIEGVHDFNGNIYVLNQSYNLNPIDVPEDPSMLFNVKEVNNEFKIQSVIHMPFPDLSGIAELNEQLYIISGDENLILVYDLQNNLIIEEAKIPVTGNQEGITFDLDGYMYIAVDGEGVFKIKLEVNNVD